MEIAAGAQAKISRHHPQRPREVLSQSGSPSQALPAPSPTFSFIPCLEGYPVGGNTNPLSCCIQAAARSLFALFFAGKSLNSPPKAGLFPRATPWTGIRSCGQRAVSGRLEPLGFLQHKPLLTVASSEQKPPWPALNPQWLLRRDSGHLSWLVAGIILPLSS